MAGFKKTVLTAKGRNLYAKAQTGTPISFTRVKIGSGQLAVGQTLENLTDLINPVMNLPIQSIIYLGDGRTRIRMVISNAGLVTGFYFREIGLYATDPNEGEVLYCVSNAGSEADFIPEAGAVAFEQILDVVTAIGSASVTAIIQDNGSHVLLLDFEDHLSAATIDHPDGSVTAAKLANSAAQDRVVGNRTIDQSQAPDASSTGYLTKCLSWLANRIKAITGKTNWYDAPTKTLEQLYNEKLDKTGSIAGSQVSSKVASAAYADSAGNADVLDGYHASSFLTDAAHSFAENGYQKLSNGLIFQWGKSPQSSNNYQITFPIAFTNACLAVNVTKGATTGYGTQSNAATASEHTLTGFKLRCNDSGTGVFVTWIAIGY